MSEFPSGADIVRTANAAVKHMLETEGEGERIIDLWAKAGKSPPPEIWTQHGLVPPIETEQARVERVRVVERKAHAARTTEELKRRFGVEE
jgi:hypothetical protein